jgi:hypothetical protein
MACAAATAALFAVPVTPASAGLAGGTSVAEHHPLPADLSVPPTGDGKFQVMTVLIGLQAGQSRRVSDQLTLSLTDDHHPEVDSSRRRTAGSCSTTGLRPPGQRVRMRHRSTWPASCR